MATHPGSNSGVDDEKYPPLGSELPLLSSPSGSFVGDYVPGAAGSTPAPEPDKPLEARIVAMPCEASSQADKPSKKHDERSSNEWFPFLRGRAVAPEKPASSFSDQQKSLREQNSVHSMNRSLSKSRRGTTGVLTTSLKASRLFLSHCWRNVDIKTRREEMFSHLTEKGCMFWADFLDLQEEGAVAWRKEIEDAIQGCSKFVSFIDYQYLLSFNCLEEMMFALREQKPIVLSILDQDAWDLLTCAGAAQKAWNAQPSTGLPLSSFDGKSMGPGGAKFSLQMLEEIFTAIGNINFCPCRDLDIQLQGKDQIYERLHRFVEQDLDHAKEYADLKHRVELWEAAGRPARLLLAGKDAMLWHQWIKVADKIFAQPSPSPSQRAFVRASVKRRKQQTKLRLGMLTVAVLLILVGAIAAVVMAFRAEHERGVAEQQRFLAEQQKTLADKQRIIAEQQRSVAEQQRAIAEERKAEAEFQGAVASTLLLSGDREPYTTAGVRAQNFAADRAESFGIPEVVLPALHDTLKHLLDKPYQFLDFEGHRAQIDSVDFSPSGSSLLSSSKDGTVIVWPISWDPSAMVPDLVEPVVLTGEDWGTDYCVFAQWMDEDTFAAAFESGNFQVWRRHAVDGWKAELSATPHKKKILAMAVSRDGFKVATGDKKKTIAVWSFDEETSLLSEHSETVFDSNERAMALVFSPDGRYLIFENNKGTLSYTDTEGDLEETIAVLAELPASESVTALAFSPDGQWLAVGSGGGVTYLIDWNETSVNASKVVHSITSPMQTVSSFQVVTGLAWSSESSLIVAADVGTVSFWEILEDDANPSNEPVLLHQMVYKTTADSAPIHATGVAFSDKVGGGTIALSSEESMLRLWHHTPQLGLEGPQAFQVQMTPDHPSRITAVSWSKTRMAVCSAEGGLSIRELNPVTGDWSEAAIVPVADGAIEGAAQCRSLGWAPDESMVAAGLDDNTIEVWHRHDDGTWARVMHGASSGAVRRNPGFSPDGRWLAVPGKDSPEIYLFHVPSHASPGNQGEEPVQPDLILSHDEGEIKSVAWAPFSPSGAGDLVLASSGEDNTRLWDLSHNGSEESAGLTIEGSTIVTKLGFSYATRMDWSVDGRLFAMSHEGFGGVWHWQRGSNNSSDNTYGAWACLLRVEGHTGILGSVSWSPDGSQLVIPFDDNSLRIYNVDGQAGLAELLYQIEHKCEWLMWIPVSLLDRDTEASRIACVNTVGAPAAEGETFDYAFNMLVVDFAEQHQLLQRMTYGHLTARDLQIMRLERLQDQVLT